MSTMYNNYFYYTLYSRPSCRFIGQVTQLYASRLLATLEVGRAMHDFQLDSDVCFCTIASLSFLKRNVQ